MTPNGLGLISARYYHDVAQRAQTISQSVVELAIVMASRSPWDFCEADVEKLRSIAGTVQALAIKSACQMDRIIATFTEEDLRLFGADDL